MNWAEYWLDPQEAGAYEAWCLMDDSYGGGGWTLVAVSSDDGTDTWTWDNRIYVLAVGRWGGATRQPRPRECHPASGIASTIGSDGVLLSAFDRGQTIRPSDGVGQQTAIGVVRWTTDGFERPALSYPSLWTDKTDKDGYLSNGLVRMRPDDRFEGGDYIDPYEKVTCRRLPAEQRHFPDMGNKGTVVCRHPDGSLLSMSRDPVLFRSTDDGRTWQRAAEIERIGKLAGSKHAERLLVIGVHALDQA